MHTTLAEKPRYELPPVVPPDDDAPTLPNGNQRWSVPILRVKQTIQERQIPEEQASELLWLQDYGWRNNKSLADVANELRGRNGQSFDRATVWKILKGEYPARIDNFITAIIELRRLVESRTGLAFPFVKTARAEEVWDLCDLALTTQDIVFLYGPSHCGKTTPLVAYAKSKPFGRVIYVEMQTGGYIAEFKQRLGAALGISGKYSTAELTRRIIAAVTGDMLVIVDELTRCFLSKGERMDTIEFLRELHDATGCGMVLSATLLARERMERGQNRDVYEQLINRSIATVTFEKMPSKADLAQFAEAIGLPAATGDALNLQDATINRKSLGRWIKLLKLGMKFAKNKGAKIAWEHVIHADRILARKEQAK